VIVSEVRKAQRRPLQLLAGVCVLLALMCVALAVAWKVKADEASCWREALEEDETVAAADCAP
jgi:hypothetical protein